MKWWCIKYKVGCLYYVEKRKYVAYMKWLLFSVHVDAFIKGTNGDFVYVCESIGNVTFVHIMAWQLEQ